MNSIYIAIALLSVGIIASVATLFVSWFCWAKAREREDVPIEWNERAKEFLESFEIVEPDADGHSWLLLRDQGVCSANYRISVSPADSTYLLLLLAEFRDNHKQAKIVA